MKALIDIRDPASVLTLFDINLAERILRQLWVRGVREAWILTDSRPLSLKAEFAHRFPMTVRTIRINESLSSEPADWIIVDGNGIYDDRVLDSLVNATEDIRIFDSLKRLTPIALKVYYSETTDFISDVFERRNVIPTETHLSDIRAIDSYIPFLRKSYVPTLRFVDEHDNLREIENDLFEKTFKSGLEWIAIYGYKIPVRELTRFFANTPVTPNHITAVAMVCRWVSIPLLFMNWIGLGLLLIVFFIILDSLDGKLARMTFRFSDHADWIDHGSVLPTRLGWYAGLGWHYSGGDYTSPVGLMTLATFVFIVLDDINWVIAKRLFRRTLFDITDFDSTVHLFTHRRNDMFVMLLGYFLGVGLNSFAFICLWVFGTWLWHSCRIIYVVSFLGLHKK
ncbi:CDP-alcohol phosphatidyltransferase family protein [bacterium]|nr:MAG: CDP-alcohol phosphatidyltransferase family protein [bacterium]